MDFRKIKAQMVLHGDNGNDLSEYLGISRNTLSAKMHETNNSEFTVKEIKKIKKRYSLSCEEIDNIFFTD